MTEKRLARHATVISQLLTMLTTVTGTIVGIVSASIRPVFLTSNGIVKMFLNTMGKINKHRKIALIARGKLKSIEKMISKALIDFGSSHEEFFLD